MSNTIKTKSCVYILAIGPDLLVKNIILEVKTTPIWGRSQDVLRERDVNVTGKGGYAECDTVAYSGQVLHSKYFQADADPALPAS